MILSNAIWVLFPQVIRMASDDLNHGVTKQKIVYFAGLLIAVASPQRDLFISYAMDHHRRLARD